MTRNNLGVILLALFTTFESYLMAFHLEKPFLTTVGKSKKRTKFSSSAAKQRKEQLDAEWKQMQKDWDKLTPKFGNSKTKSTVKAVSVPALTVPPGREAKQQVKSLNSWITGPVSSKPSPQYTGDAMLGIVVQHKSCLQPVFSQESAIDSAKMRR